VSLALANLPIVINNSVLKYNKLLIINVYKQNPAARAGLSACSPAFKNTQKNSSAYELLPVAISLLFL